MCRALEKMVVTFISLLKEPSLPLTSNTDQYNTPLTVVSDVFFSRNQNKFTKPFSQNFPHFLQSTLQLHTSSCNLVHSS